MNRFLKMIKALAKARAVAHYHFIIFITIDHLRENEIQLTVQNDRSTVGVSFLYTALPFHATAQQYWPPPRTASMEATQGGDDEKDDGEMSEMTAESAKTVLCLIC
jgi:hypothetical protein